MTGINYRNKDEKEFSVNGENEENGEIWDL